MALAYNELDSAELVGPTTAIGLDCFALYIRRSLIPNLAKIGLYVGNSTLLQANIFAAAKLGMHFSH